MRLTIPQHQLTLSGNTAGALSNLSSGTVTLAGGNNITLSQAGNAVTISALATSSLSATGAVSISVNGSTISIGAPAQTVQTQNVVDVTLDGNTDGALALISSGTMTLAGGNNITLSQAGNAVTISGAAAGGAQTFIAGISASDTLYTSGNVRISGSQAATVRSGTGQLVIIDVPAQSTQVETQTFIAGVSASDTLYTSGNVRITGVGGGITVSSNTGQRIDLSVAAQSVQPETQTFIAGVSASDTLYTSGNVRITGVGGGVTVSSNTGQRVDISVAAPVAQTNQAGSVYAISNTSGTSSGTYDARTLSIAGAGMITVAASNSGWRINATQSVQPETQTFISGISASDTLYTSGQVRITGVGGGVTVSSNTGQRVDISVAAPVAATNLSVGVSTGGNTLGDTGVATGSRFVIVGSNGITASQGTAAGATTVTLSGVTQSVQTQGGFVSLGVSTGGNTAGNTQVSTGSRFVIVASGNATASQATAAGASTVTISVAAQTVQTQGILNVALSNVGNTAGDTGINSGTRLVLSGGANITLSQVTAANATTVGIVGGAGGAGGSFSGGVSTGGNTAGATGITGTQNVFVGVTPMSLSQTTGANGGTISILAPATSSLSATGAVEISTNGSTISIGAPNIKTLADLQNFPAGQAGLMTLVAGISKTPFYFPMSIGGKITQNSFVVRLSAVTTATLQSFTIHGGYYTQPNSTSMALLGSWSETYVLSTASSASWSGVRNYVMTGQGTHANLSVLNGGDYVIGLMFSAGASQSVNLSLMGAGIASGALGRIVPGVNQNSTGTSQGVQALNGRGSTTVNALPANVVASELVNQGTAGSAMLHPWIYIRS